MIFSKKFDIHSIIHFIGSYALVPTIMVLLNFSLTKAALFAFLVGVLWELFDELNFQCALNIKFLDPRGMDFFDILTNSLGILIAIGVFSTLN